MPTGVSLKMLLAQVRTSHLSALDLAVSKKSIE
jgi:hypothetical protein